MDFTEYQQLQARVIENSTLCLKIIKELRILSTILFVIEILDLIKLGLSLLL